jgi:hypothetical protein
MASISSTPQVPEPPVAKRFMCPKCTMTGLRETILSGGYIRHEHISCCYLMIWRPRDPWTPEKRREALAEAQKTFSGRVHPD